MMKYFERDPRRKIYLILILICLGGLYFTAKHFLKTDEEIVREVIRGAAKAIEDEDMEKLGELISPNYLGYFGTSREEALRMAKRRLRRVEKLSINIGSIEVRIEGRRAEVGCYFTGSGYYTGSEIYNRIPFKGKLDKDGGMADRADIVLERDGGSWRVVEIEIHSPYV
jgi:hypothetical protein